MKNSGLSTRMVTLPRKDRSLSVCENVVDLSTPHYTQSVHWHDFFELEMVLSGSATHLLNGKSYRIQPGSLYLLTPADLHTLLPDPDSEDTVMTLLNISFTDTLVAGTPFIEVQTLPPPITAEASGKELEHFLNLMSLMRETQRQQGPQVDNAMRHLFFAFVYKFLRLYQLQHTDIERKEPDATVNRELSYIRNAIAYIRYNFRDPNISITKIAAAVCLSPNYFGTIFKKHMGETCLSYIKKLRLSFATVLLQNSALTIAEISDKCGYSNVPYFISDFRMAYGMPPKKHRDSHSHMTDPLDEPSNL